jgi:hypothetical protein
MNESFTAVEVAERFADGGATREELERAEWVDWPGRWLLECVFGNPLSLDKS